MASNRDLDRDQPHYFGAGPALLPSEVLKAAAFDLVSFGGQNLGVGEISHRSKDAIKVIDDTKANIVELLGVPETHEVFFLQGGGTTGFAATAYNLFAHYATKNNGKKGKAAYAVNGVWSKKASQEAKRLGFDIDIVTNAQDNKFTSYAPYSEWKPIDKDNTAYLYLCDNETVNGMEYHEFPSDYVPEGVEVVADMSSNILSKAVDVSKYGLIYAGAQKNVGLAGLTIYIIKKALLEQASDEQLASWGIPVCPIAMHFPSVVSSNSLYNTIPVFTCQILKLVTDKLLAEGGITEIQKTNEKKAAALYGALEKYPSVYKLTVKPQCRSNMNVVFNLGTDELEAEFLKQSAAKGLTGLKGHRSVGGIRASIYNAVALDSVLLLVEFVEEYAKKHT